MTNTIYHGDNLSLLQKLEDQSIDLIYARPPKGTLEDIEAYLAELEPRLYSAYRTLKPSGALYFHGSHETVHYVKVKLLDPLFGSRDCFINEIIWAYDPPAAQNRWTPNHDTLLVYAKTPDEFVFNLDAIDRIRYLAPGLVGAEKEKRGKLPTDTWWYSNIEKNGEEEMGRSNLPLQIIKRIVAASSNPGDLVLDLYARDGKVGEACQALDRNFISVDQSADAVKRMVERFKGAAAIEWINVDLK